MNKAIMALLVAAPVMIAGCTSTPPTISTLETARATVARVEHHEMAGEVAGDEIELAHAALREADKLVEDGASREEIDHAAYMAQKHAEIAEQQVARAEAQAVVANSESEREKAELEARAQALQQQLAEMNAKQTDRGMVLTLGDVLFDTGQATLKAGAQSTIDRLAEFLRDSPESTVVIEGHTDSVGSDDYNMQLSQRRADAVRMELLNRNVVSTRVSAAGKGESAPIASNDTDAGRQQNRRVEIIIENAEGSDSVVAN
jgi:outer membrane protein OmpA-like peptidoglycan-associated protein